MNDEQIVTFFLQELKNLKEYDGDLKQVIYDLADSHNMEVLYQIAVALEVSDKDDMRLCDVESVFDYLECVVAFTSGFLSIETLFRLSLIKRETSVQHPRTTTTRNSYLAYMLVSGQQLPALLQVFEQHIHDEFYLEIMSFLIQEMVVRGWLVEDISIIKFLHEKMVQQQLPLAWLPLKLTELEVDLPSGIQSNGLTFPEVSFDSLSASFHPKRDRENLLREITTDYDCERIKTVISNWEEESNGMSEARTFVIEQHNAQDVIVPQIFTSLPLLCLNNDNTKARIQEIPSTHAFTILFRAAATGGAYNRGHQTARGRLEAWSSLAGLVGAEEGASVAQILQAARQCRWFAFDTNTWFYHFVWDLGLMAIRPDTRSLAILAATDTD